MTSAMVLGICGVVVATVTSGCADDSPAAAPLATIAVESITPAPPVTDGSGVLLLGDSLTDQSRAALAVAMPLLAVDAFVGRTVSQPLLADTGLGRVGELRGTAPRWWIVELGTNDAAFAKRSLDDMRADIGQLLDAIGREACVAWVLPYVVGPVPSDDIDRTNGFALIAADEVGKLNCHAIIQWSETVTAETNILGADGIHFTDHGRQRYAEVIAQAIATLPTVG